MKSDYEQLIWYACGEHIDIVIDEIVDRFSIAPTMELYSSDRRNGSKKECYWCGGFPEYQLEIELEDEQ
ncbi:CxxH/CxxC protein [Paenactinomyces guangxiensis]|uniref:CxxH/CxxC protein n=1 Tax=Paenactinomyces guangxiensis TaxID=1490290 RepID=A0A7W1WQJ0_9BACL|nr:CxxH/CxxC protein [Paenactinomyces guangxiensis]MBA4494084.1 CxxH/CxxC protein [Paenactinomyces guangxiensis]MBH8591171.1 CxxH/CxxC protein [Paenactinomyces guangxiensis]